MTTGPLAKLLDAPALAPLRGRVYRGLWLAWAAANLAMWSHDVAAAWLMTQITSSPVMVALVQTASTLPVFLFGIASGALADIVDRRRWFAATQLWVSANAILLALLAALDALTAPLLLLLTFANGMGLAARWPVFSAIVPEVVKREELSQAMALGGISMNLARVIGPVMAGALLAAAGPSVVFSVNAVFGVVSCVLVLRWKAQPKKASALPGERFVGAMRVGLQHVAQSPAMKIAIGRVFIFFLQASALLALLALVARDAGGGAGLYAVLMAAMGLGAIVSALQLPRLRQRWAGDAMVRWGTLVHALASTLAVSLPTPWIQVPAVALTGAAWIATTNTLVTSAQMALPNWVRARGMSIYQMAIMAGTAFGAWVWGHVAGWVGVAQAIAAAALCGVVLLYLTRRWSIEGVAIDDLSPQPARPIEVAIDVQPEEGPVMVQVEYRIDPADAAAFAEVMQATRAARLRQGALSWGLFRDTAVPGRYVEYFVDENWVEHLRRQERFTAADEGLRARRLAFHKGEGPPVVKRYVAEGTVPEPGGLM
ncbi:MAG: MFS transporter [Rubrivivax sp.]